MNNVNRKKNGVSSANQSAEEMKILKNDILWSIIFSSEELFSEEGEGDEIEAWKWRRNIMK